MIAPAGTSTEIVRKVQQEVARQLQSEEIKEVLAKQGSNAIGSKPEAFADFIRTETKKWERVVKISGIQPN
jgi:tripartite-type tricarboxylate transporter receptor subunit TctC